MKTYNVIVPCAEIRIFNIKAKNKKEAKSKAIEGASSFFHPSFPSGAGIIKGKISVIEQ